MHWVAALIINNEHRLTNSEESSCFLSCFSWGRMIVLPKVETTMAIAFSLLHCCFCQKIEKIPHKRIYLIHGFIEINVCEKLICWLVCKNFALPSEFTVYYLGSFQQDFRIIFVVISMLFMYWQWRFTLRRSTLRRFTWRRFTLRRLCCAASLGCNLMECMGDITPTSKQHSSKAPLGWYCRVCDVMLKFFHDHHHNWLMGLDLTFRDVIALAMVCFSQLFVVEVTWFFKKHRLVSQ